MKRIVIIGALLIATLAAQAEIDVDSIANNIRQFAIAQESASPDSCQAWAETWVAQIPHDELKTYASQGEKILYAPHSSLPCRITYRALLQRLLQENDDDMSMLRYRYMYEAMLHNNEGDEAIDFVFYDPADQEHNLRQYIGHSTLIIFNDPECEECAMLRQHIVDTGELGGYNIDSTTTVLVIYPDMPTDEWREAVVHYPRHWIVGYAEDVSDMYDLRTLPSTYLLDNNHRILLRNAHTYITDRE